MSIEPPGNAETRLQVAIEKMSPILHDAIADMKMQEEILDQRMASSGVSLSRGKWDKSDRTPRFLNSAATGRATSAASAKGPMRNSLSISRSKDGSWIVHFPGLAQFDENWRQELVACSRVVSLPAGSRIFGPGQAPENFLLLIEGTLRVQQVSPAGREIVLYRVSAGESCALTTACLMSYDARAGMAYAAGCRGDPSSRR